MFVLVLALLAIAIEIDNYKIRMGLLAGAAICLGVQIGQWLA